MSGSSVYHEKSVYGLERMLVDAGASAATVLGVRNLETTYRDWGIEEGMPLYSVLGSAQKRLGATRRRRTMDSDFTFSARAVARFSRLISILPKSMKDGELYTPDPRSDDYKARLFHIRVACGIAGANMIEGPVESQVVYLKECGARQARTRDLGSTSDEEVDVFEPSPRLRHRIRELAMRQWYQEARDEAAIWHATHGGNRRELEDLLHDVALVIDKVTRDGWMEEPPKGAPVQTYAEQLDRIDHHIQFRNKSSDHTHAIAAYCVKAIDLAQVLDTLFPEPHRSFSAEEKDLALTLSPETLAGRRTFLDFHWEHDRERYEELVEEHRTEHQEVYELLKKNVPDVFVGSYRLMYAAKGIMVLQRGVKHVRNSLHTEKWSSEVKPYHLEVLHSCHQHLTDVIVRVMRQEQNHLVVCHGINPDRANELETSVRTRFATMRRGRANGGRKPSAQALREYDTFSSRYFDMIAGDQGKLGYLQSRWEQQFRDAYAFDFLATTFRRNLHKPHTEWVHL